MVAEIIALASDEPESVEAVKKLPATVQLIALAEVWKASVPDPKKARELLSEVTALLRKVSLENPGIKQMLSQTPSLSPSTSSSERDTIPPVFGAIQSPASNTT